MEQREAPVVVETPGGLSVSYGGRLLYSPRDPARLPRRSAEACDPGPRRLVLAASPLLWYGLPELLGRLGEGSKVLCVEADPALAELAARRAPPGLLADARVSFLATGSPQAVLEAARALGSFRMVARVALSGGEALNAGAYRAMAELLQSEFESSWRNRSSLMAMGRLWAKNLLDNVASLGDIEARPFPRFPGATAVCGAGPSLEDALPLIARRREELSLVACDTALGSLLAAGIMPDLVVCLEAQAHNLADFTPLGRRPLALVADLSSHPATFRASEGPKHLSAVRIKESPFLERATACAEAAGAPLIRLPPLGSVGVHAVHLARILSSGPVLAFGLDFSFEAGKTHARGCPALLATERRLSRLDRWAAQYVAAFGGRARRAPCPPLGDGRDLLSDPVLLSYAELLAQEAALPGPALYDARGRGPSIGAPRLGLGEAERLVDAARAAAPTSSAGGAARLAEGGAPSRPAAEAAARAFLEGEAARLDALYDIMKGSRRAASGELARLVAECDYLYWSFPDGERAAELPQDFLNRLLPEVEWWSSRVARLRDAL